MGADGDAKVDVVALLEASTSDSARDLLDRLRREKDPLLDKLPTPHKLAAMEALAAEPSCATACGICGASLELCPEEIVEHFAQHSKKKLLNLADIQAMLQDKTGATASALGLLLAGLSVRSAVEVIDRLRMGIFVDQSLADDQAILNCASAMARRANPDAAGASGGGSGGSQRPPTSQTAAKVRRRDYVRVAPTGKKFSVYKLGII